MMLGAETRDEGAVATAFDGLLQDLANKQKRLCMVEVMLRRIEAPLKGIQQELRSKESEIDKLKKEIDEAYESRQSLPKEIEEQSDKLKVELNNLESIRTQVEKSQQDCYISKEKLETETGSLQTSARNCVKELSMLLAQWDEFKLEMRITSSAESTNETRKTHFQEELQTVNKRIKILQQTIKTKKEQPAEEHEQLDIVSSDDETFKAEDWAMGMTKIYQDCTNLHEACLVFVDYNICWNCEG